MLWTFWSVRQRVVCRVSDGSVRYGGLIDAESELHALDSSTGVLVDLAVAFLFGGPLPDHVGGVVLFEVWCGELLYAPGGWLGTRVGKEKLSETYLPFSLSSLSPMHLPSFLNSRLD